MTVTTVERDLFGEPLAPIERVVCAVVLGIGAAGHAALAAAAALLLYTLAVGVAGA